MWIRSIATLLGAGILMAQDAPDAPAVKQQKARELLEKLQPSLGALSPEVNVIALAQLSGAWKPLDSARAISCLRQAFAAAAALSDDSDRPARSRMQAEIVKLAVEINLAEAAELLHGMPAGAAPDSRAEAADMVVGKLIGKHEFDQAMEVLALTPAEADYPFAAASRLFEELPKDDSRRVLVFGNAAAAYRRRPGDGFRTLVAKHWKEVPREMATTALGAIVSTILGRDDEPGAGESLETAQGTVKLGSRKSMELFDLLGVIRALDPGRWKILEDQYADLRAAAQKFPEGRQSVDQNGTLRTVARKNGSDSNFSDSDEGFTVMPPLSMFDGVDERNMQDTLRAYMTAMKKAQQAWGAFQKDHTRGLSLVDDVALPSLRAELLIKFAGLVKQDEAAARGLLSKATAQIADIADLGDRLAPAISAAELEHDLKDDKAAWGSIEQARDGLVAAYKKDTDAERPNRALQEFWPSTLSCRAFMYHAAKFFGTRAEELLESLPGPDLAVMAQIELARAWLGVSAFDSEHGSFSWQVLH